MIENLTASLRVMGFGMLGIFSVTIVMILVMLLLTKLFPPKKDENTEPETPDPAD